MRNKCMKVRRHAIWQCGILSSAWKTQSPKSLVWLLWKPGNQKKNLPQRKGGLFTNNLSNHWVISTASVQSPKPNEHWGILHEFQGTKWSKASNEIHGSPTFFPHPGPAETMDRLILGCKMGCKIVALHPIMVDKCRILAHEWYLICILNGMSYLASWTERLRLCSYKPGGF